MIDELPTWADSFIRELLWELDLDNMRIQSTVHRVIEDEPRRLADISVQAEYLVADLRVRNDIEDSYGWAEILVHEIVHITHARIDAFVREALIEGTPNEKALRTAYQQHMEHHITSLTRIIMRYRRWLTNIGATAHEPTEGEKIKSRLERKEAEDAVQKQGTSEVYVQPASVNSPKVVEGVREEAPDQATPATRVG
jgi:hypothetical protein